MKLTKTFALLTAFALIGSLSACSDDVDDVGSLNKETPSPTQTISDEEAKRLEEEREAKEREIKEANERAEKEIAEAKENFEKKAQALNQVAPSIESGGNAKVSEISATYFNGTTMGKSLAITLALGGKVVSIEPMSNNYAKVRVSTPDGKGFANYTGLMIGDQINIDKVNADDAFLEWQSTPELEYRVERLVG